MRSYQALKQQEQLVEEGCSLTESSETWTEPSIVRTHSTTSTFISTQHVPVIPPTQDYQMSEPGAAYDLDYPNDDSHSDSESPRLLSTPARNSLFGSVGSRQMALKSSRSAPNILSPRSSMK